MYQIDQSNKIENTSKNTVIAYSNGTQRAVLIPRKVKRQIQEVFREQGLTKIFIYQTFAVGVYFLIREFKQSQPITIDTEYPGKDKIISDMLCKLLESHGRPQHEIKFDRIGNKPPAHYAAKNVNDGKKKADKILGFEEIMRAIKTADGRLRECISTLVDARPRLLRKCYQKKGRKSRRR